MKPRHGQERNHREFRSEGKTVEFVADDGSIAYSGPICSSTNTAKEKFCAHCNEWHECGTRGFCAWIIDNMRCPKCGENW